MPFAGSEQSFIIADCRPMEGSLRVNTGWLTILAATLAARPVRPHLSPDDGRSPRQVGKRIPSTETTARTSIIRNGPLAVGTETRNRVLRNTYGLLALSMIPTVIGAWIGVATRFTFFAGSPAISFIAFLAIAWGFMFGISRYRNSSAGILLLLGFTFFMGLMLSRLLGFVLGMSNGASLVMMAFGSTAVIFGAMATIATVSKRDFSGMGRWLFVGMIVILLAAFANIFLQIPALMLTISLLATVVFSLFILFDLTRVVTGGETNYVMATLSVYINLYNVFSNLLALFGIAGGNND